MLRRMTFARTEANLSNRSSCFGTALSVTKIIIIAVNLFVRFPALYKLPLHRNFSEKYVWLHNSLLYSCNVDDMSYRQVLTLINNAQLILKLEILDKFKFKHKGNCNIF